MPNQSSQLLALTQLCEAVEAIVAAPALPPQYACRALVAAVSSLSDGIDQTSASIGRLVDRARGATLALETAADAKAVR
jgi:hypothetical protein